MPPTRHRYRCIRQIAGHGRSETRGEAPQGQIGHSSDNQSYRGLETRAQRDERDPPRDVLALQRAPTRAVGRGLYQGREGGYLASRFALSSAASAPGVATMCPSGNNADMTVTPLLNPCGRAPPAWVV